MRSSISPENANAWAGKGSILLNLKRYEEALKAFKKVIKLDPENVNAWAAKGIALFKLEKYEEALEVYEKTIDLDPKYIRAWVSKGIILGKLEKYEKALKAYEKAIELDSKNVGAHIYLGEFLYYLGDFKGSYDEVKILLDMDENNALALSLQGRINIENKDYCGAAKSFENAISLSIANPILFLWDAYANYLNIEFPPSSKIGEVYQEKENITLIVTIQPYPNSLNALNFFIRYHNKLPLMQLSEMEQMAFH